MSSKPRIRGAYTNPASYGAPKSKPHGVRDNWDDVSDCPDGCTYNQYTGGCDCYCNAVDCGPGSSNNQVFSLDCPGTTCQCGGPTWTTNCSSDCCPGGKLSIWGTVMSGEIIDDADCMCGSYDADGNCDCAYANTVMSQGGGWYKKMGSHGVMMICTDQGDTGPGEQCFDEIPDCEGADCAA